MINSNTSFGKLKEVIVGREIELPEKSANLIFDTFFQESVGQAPYESPIDEYEINYNLLKKRIKDLNNLAKTLEDLGIKVYRPNVLNKLVKFETPYFKSEITPANNVRDISFVYKDTIVETPTYVRNRYFENDALFDIFRDKFYSDKNTKWIKSPHNRLTEKSVDLLPLNYTRDYNKIDKKYDMAIDGAHFLRIGKDVIVNVRNYNHYLGYQWVKSLFPESEFHMISIEYDHLDGTLLCLKPGVFLVDPKYKNMKDLLPNKFRNWTYLYPDENIINSVDTRFCNNIDKLLAKDRIADLNILSIDEKNVLVKNNAYATIKTLENNGFNIIPIELTDDEIFKGGIHCSTLDLVREDEYEFYT